MASNMDQSNDTNSTTKTHKVKSQSFSKLVGEFAEKLPAAFEIISGGRYSETKDAENKSVQLDKGDVLWVTKINVESITVSVEGSKKKEHPVVLPSDWSGKVQLPSNEAYPVGHVFSSVAELAKDFPIFVTVKEELEVDGIVVKEGGRLKLIRQMTTTVGGKFLVCQAVETGDNVNLPEDLEGKFEKTEQDVRFDVKDVAGRLPLHVVFAKGPTEDREDESTSGDQHIEGIPEDYTGSLLLNSVTYSEAVLWETSNQDNVKVLKIPSDTKMEVVALEDWTEEKGPANDVMDLAKSARKGKWLFFICKKGTTYRYFSYNIVNC